MPLHDDVDRLWGWSVAETDADADWFHCEQYSYYLEEEMIVNREYGTLPDKITFGKPHHLTRPYRIENLLNPVPRTVKDLKTNQS